VATAPTFAELADPLFARLQGRLFIAQQSHSVCLLPVGPFWPSFLLVKNI